MRTAFIKTLTKMVENDKRVMLLVGDLGFGVVTDFAERFPDQYLNVGVAEQNMAGVAAGLAMSGKVVFTYSIGNFPIIRCLEQIRNDICYHQANVISVSIGGGFCYGALGMTHHATEDIAIMRSLPYMKVIAPGDPQEAQKATEYLAQGNGPAYLRLGRAGEPDVHSEAIHWQLGKAVTVRHGGDLTLITTGGMLKTAMDAAETLQQKHRIEVGVISMHTLKPLDVDAVLDAVSETRCLLTVEEHSHIGGLGGAVSEVLAEHAHEPFCFQRIALPSEFTKHVGSQEYLCKIYGLDADSIAEKASRLFEKK